MTGCGTVTATCGVQGPQGIPGPSGSPISNVAPAVASASLTASQNTTLFTNTGALGAINLTLPPSQTPFIPMSFSLLVTVAQTLAFVAPSGVVIINGVDSSSVGGSLSSNVIGNYVTIVMASPTQWIVTNITGVWNLT